MSFLDTVWRERTPPQKGAIVGVIFIIISFITIFPALILINLLGMIYESIFGYQGEFGGSVPVLLLYLLLPPLIGYLIGLLGLRKNE